MKKEDGTNGDGERSELLSVVVPAYNEQEALMALHESLTQVVETLPLKAEIIYVNDGSTDDTLPLLRRLKDVDERVGIVHLSRNFGKEIASTAGLDHARGDAVILMDADLQHPPEMIPDFVEQWKAGYDVVYARRETRDDESRLKKLLVQVFYFCVKKASQVQIPEGTSDYRLLSRRAVDALSRCRERHRFMKGLFAWIGYPQKSIPYVPNARHSGETKWSYWDLWTFALEGITSFTTAPLKAATYLGLLTATTAFIHAAVIVYRTFLYGDPVAGFPSLMVVISFLGGVQLITLGVIGEYLGRMFEESKQRPLYIVEEFVPSSRSQSAAAEPYPYWSNVNQ